MRLRANQKLQPQTSALAKDCLKPVSLPILQPIHKSVMFIFESANFPVQTLQSKFKAILNDIYGKLGLN